MSEMQQTRKIEQPKTEPKQTAAEQTHAEHLKRADLTRQVPAGERTGPAPTGSGDAGDNTKRRNIDAHKNINVSGNFDSAAGRQAVADHFRQQEAKKPEARTDKTQQEAARTSDTRQRLQAETATKAREGAALQQRAAENTATRGMNRSEVANAARVSASDHNNRPREGLKAEAKPTEQRKKPAVKES